MQIAKKLFLIKIEKNFTDTFFVKLLLIIVDKLINLVDHIWDIGYNFNKLVIHSAQRATVSSSSIIKYSGTKPERSARRVFIRQPETVLPIHIYIYVGDTPTVIEPQWTVFIVYCLHLGEAWFLVFMRIFENFILSNAKNLGSGEESIWESI